MKLITFLSIHFIKFFIKRLYWFVPFWYKISMWCTRFAALGINVQPFASAEGIAERIDGRNNRKDDPWKGVLDVMIHPSLVQKRFYNSKKIGDCEDHAIYWATALIQSYLAKNVWIGTVQYKKHGATKTSGHVRCIWEDHDGLFWCADYYKPYGGFTPIDFETFWIQDYLDQATVLGTIVIPVTGINRKGTPQFGKVKDIVAKIDYPENIC